MYQLHPDVQITRRGRLFMILDDAGDLKWSGPSLINALEWLRERDQMECRLVTDEIEYRLEFTFIPN